MSDDISARQEVLRDQLLDAYLSVDQTVLFSREVTTVARSQFGVLKEVNRKITLLVYS